MINQPVLDDDDSYRPVDKNSIRASMGSDTQDTLQKYRHRIQNTKWQLKEESNRCGVFTSFSHADDLLLTLDRAMKILGKEYEDNLQALRRTFTMLTLPSERVDSPAVQASGSGAPTPVHLKCNKDNIDNLSKQLRASIEDIRRIYAENDWMIDEALSKWNDSKLLLIDIMPSLTKVREGSDEFQKSHGKATQLVQAFQLCWSLFPEYNIVPLTPSRATIEKMQSQVVAELSREEVSFQAWKWNECQRLHDLGVLYVAKNRSADDPDNLRRICEFAYNPKKDCNYILVEMARTEEEAFRRIRIRWKAKIDQLRTLQDELTGQLKTPLMINK